MNGPNGPEASRRDLLSRSRCCHSIWEDGGLSR